MNKKESVSKSYIYNLCYQILVIIIPIITTPYLARTLGAEQIGVYSYTHSIVSTFTLVGILGLTLYGQREIAYVQNDKYKRSKAFWEIMLFKLITIVISIVVYYFTCIMNNQYRIYYIIFLIEIIANFFDVSWFLQGLEEFKKTVLRNIIVKTLSTILIFTLVKSPSDLYIYALIYTISVLLGNVSLCFYIPKYIEKISIRKLEIKKHIKPALLLFIPQIALQVYMILDKTMLGAMIVNKSEVGYYEQSQKIIRLLLAIITSLGTVMLSRIANIFANDEKEKLNSYIKKSFNFTLLLSIPMMLGLIAVSDYFIPIFLGEGYEKASLLLKIISPMMVIVGLNNITGTQFLLPTKKQKEFTIAVVIGAIINFLTNLIFIPLFESVGASVTSLLAETIVLGIELYYCREYINIKEIFKLAQNKIIAGTIMLIIVLLIPYIFNNLTTMIIKIGVGTITYFMILLILKDEFLKFLLQKVNNYIHNKIIKR